MELDIKDEPDGSAVLSFKLDENELSKYAALGFMLSLEKKLKEFEQEQAIIEKNANAARLNNLKKNIKKNQIKAGKKRKNGSA